MFCSLSAATPAFLRQGQPLLCAKPEFHGVPSFREPLDVPSAQTADILDHQLKAAKVDGRDGVERHIEKDQTPLEEGVGGVRYSRQRFFL